MSIRADVDQQPVGHGLEWATGQRAMRANGNGQVAKTCEDNVRRNNKGTWCTLLYGGLSQEHTLSARRIHGQNCSYGTATVLAANMQHSHAGLNGGPIPDAYGEPLVLSKIIAHVCVAEEQRRRVVNTYQTHTTIEVEDTGICRVLGF